MFLATTALSEFWDKGQEILFLGPWCLRYDRKAQWGELEYRILENPWMREGRIEDAVPYCDRVQGKLLRYLTESLNRVHSTSHGARYWRILLGSWLMTYISAFYDRYLHITAAYEAFPDLAAWAIDAEDHRVARDTLDFSLAVTTDEFNLQIYSQILAHLGKKASQHRLPGSLTGFSSADPKPLKRLTKSVADGLVAGARRLWRLDACFSDLYVDRGQALTLMRKSNFRLGPIIEELPRTMRFDPDPALRARLKDFPAADEFERLLAACLPKQLPTIFAEGYRPLRDYVLSGWKRLPKALFTSVGCYFNEYFKLLAAESTEEGAKLVVSQHGGGYGSLQVEQPEDFERAICDQYWTWGWTDGGRGRLKPMPNPRLSRGSPAPGSEAAREWTLVTCSLPRYPYSFYFANVPFWHRFDQFLEDRERFIGLLPEPLRASLSVRLHPNDMGWAHRQRLSDRFPGLSLDHGSVPWRKKMRQARLIVVDHPQTTFLEAFAANRPCVLFWRPELWPMREEAEPYYQLLREAGILRDTPESAASKVAQVHADPWSWWLESRVQRARERFCARYALASPDWARVWSAQIESVMTERTTHDPLPPADTRAAHPDAPGVPGSRA